MTAGSSPQPVSAAIVPVLEDGIATTVAPMASKSTLSWASSPVAELLNGWM